MFLRKCRQHKNGKEYAYWQLVESYRTARGSRQRVIAHLGDMEVAAREGVAEAARGECGRQLHLLEEAPEWVEVDTRRLRVERVRDFGGAWLGLQVLGKLGLDTFLGRTL